jgi:hypothetical protein
VSGSEDPHRRCKLYICTKAITNSFFVLLEGHYLPRYGTRTKSEGMPLSAMSARIGRARQMSEIRRNCFLTRRKTKRDTGPLAEKVTDRSKIRGYHREGNPECFRNSPECRLFLGNFSVGDFLFPFSPFYPQNL